MSVVDIDLEELKSTQYNLYSQDYGTSVISWRTFYFLVHLPFLPLMLHGDGSEAEQIAELLGEKTHIRRLMAYACAPGARSPQAPEPAPEALRFDRL